MSVLYIALPLALLLGAGGLVACIYCIRGGQYDDLETPAVRILLDDDKPNRTKSASRASQDGSGLSNARTQETV